MDKKTDRNIIDFISFVMKDDPRITRIFLFGSYARDLNRPDSDIDIAFIVKDLSDEEIFDYQVKYLVIASRYDTRIEPHFLSNNDLKSNPFAIEVLKTGIDITPKTSDLTLRHS